MLVYIRWNHYCVSLKGLFEVIRVVVIARRCR